MALDYQRQVRPERTGWRDESISNRHRQYGWDVPAVDIDFLMTEYDTGKPCALVEYKALGARVPQSEHASYRAIRILADAAKVPFLVVFYDAKTWTYVVFPFNAVARELLGDNNLLMPERAYVGTLYTLRNRALPDMKFLNRFNAEISQAMRRWFNALPAKES